MGLFKKRGASRMPPAIPLPPKPAPVPPPPTPSVVTPRIRLGMNVHNLTPDALDACQRYHVKRIRTTVYGASWFDPNSGAAYRGRLYKQIGDALLRGFDVLVVIHTGDPLAWHEIVEDMYDFHGITTFQLGNESDAPGEGHVDPATYAEAFRLTREAAPTAVLVAAAAGPDVAYFFRALWSAGLTADAYAVHAYGPPADQALLDRAMQLHTAIHTAMSPGYAPPVWCTEVGYGYASGAAQGYDVGVSGDPTAFERKQLESVIAVAERSVHLVERTYLYELGEDADSEGYGVRRSDGLERPAALWLASENGLPSGQSWDVNGGLPREDVA